MILLCGAVFAAIAYRAELGLTRRRVAALMLVPAFAYLLFVWPQSSVRHLRVDAISVGHGNCILTRFPDGRSLLFDAGSSGRADDIAERVIVPALWSLGVRRLDLLVLSHGDADHYNGAEDLARRMRVGGVAVTNYFDYFDDQPGPKRLIEDLSNAGVPVTRFSAGDRVAGFAGAEIAALWPPPSVPKLKWTDNELCAVVRVRTPEGAVLLTGDFGHGSAGAAHPAESGPGLGRAPSAASRARRPGRGATGRGGAAGGGDHPRRTGRPSRASLRPVLQKLACDRRLRHD